MRASGRHKTQHADRARPDAPGFADAEVTEAGQARLRTCSAICSIPALPAVSGLSFWWARRKPSPSRSAASPGVGAGQSCTNATVGRRRNIASTTRRHSGGRLPDWHPPRPHPRGHPVTPRVPSVPRHVPRMVIRALRCAAASAPFPKARSQLCRNVAMLGA